ncbi:MULTISPECIES: M15 family metallopeptidase [Pontibacillus]|uniref:D-alanyl-D-alanine carboxypeptidase family protein n=1 Tax=Pontibacillus chungwhensis TaxID=265426 RepID=A0ABY8V2T0_9BACI|nr:MULTISPECIES: M15 family metallopeptidase [Pontibacillus]MCD5324930.1 D-alanyl-D-alanine carboxypeptidase family protein [Pontibacillus sp. HN14]WIF98889.1 D-alanyl-D-alanine carboxypeptidase family protein [Pontibacillus chungwhensis]
MRRMLLIGMIGVFALTACQSETNESQPAKENASKNTTITEKEKPAKDESAEEQDKADQEPEEDQTEQNDGEKSDSSPSDDKNGEKEKPSQQPSDDSTAMVVEEPTSTEVVVNKQRKLPDGYTPPNLTVPEVPFYFDEFHEKKQMREVAARALEELFKGADQAGIDLVAASGYRSYDRQDAIFASNVQQHGEEHARQFSAVPGHSEHQTGLAMDVTVAKLSFQLSQDLGDMKEGEWLAENAHNYGFVIRYPEGKSDITGYEYEPWHLRYVGKDVATKVYNQNATLEEYYNLVP